MLLAGSARALEISEPLQVSGPYVGPLDDVATKGLSFVTFSFVGETHQASGLLFADLELTPADQGVVRWADAVSEPEFSAAVGCLTDGLSGGIGLVIPSQIAVFYQYFPPAIATIYTDAEEAESTIFANDPLRTGGLDLAGMRIDRIGFRLDQLSFAQDGSTTNVSVGASLFFEGERVPEPGLAALELLALGGATLARWRFKR
ncbi:MAG TPA: hypothetical protein VMR31_08995 [Myxococcota bacterium]|nr:hypothetical protein [Myxococcota bacterium]